VNKYFLIALILSWGLIYSFNPQDKILLTNIEFPDNWPEPIYDFKNNPITEQGFELGRKLFYDPNLSRDSTISCANCHLQYTGFTHVDHKVSHGIDGRKGTRNSPALINLAWNSSFHWDGGVNNLEVQVLNPIQSYTEMDNTLEKVIKYLNTWPEYKQLFMAAFDDSVANTKSMLKAIAQFTSSLISSNSKYDQYLRGEIDFSSQEKNGLKLFKKHCNKCHTEPLFNSNEYASNGLDVDTVFYDLGRYGITQDLKDSLKFRIPTLRNIEYTFPYMHDGRFQKLKDVLEHYTTIDINKPQLHESLKKPIILNSNQKKDLIAFLYTLTDKEFIYNKKFSFPH